MLDDVGQRLLHDPQDLRLDIAVQRLLLAEHPERRHELGRRLHPLQLEPDALVEGTRAQPGRAKAPNGAAALVHRLLRGLLREGECRQRIAPVAGNGVGVSDTQGDGRQAASDAVVHLEHGPFPFGCDRGCLRPLARLLVQPGVGDRDRCVGGEPLQQLRVGRVEPLGVGGGEDDDGADQVGAQHDRDADDGAAVAILQRTDVAVGHLRVLLVDHRLA